MMRQKTGALVVVDESQKSERVLLRDADDLARLAGLVDAWRAELDLTPATIYAYGRGAQRWLTWWSTRPDLTPATAVRAWRDAELASGQSAASVNTHLAGVRSFCAWLARCGAGADLAAGVRSARSRGKFHKRDLLTRSEVLAVLAGCDDSFVGRRTRAILCLMAYCAARTIEIQRAEMDDLATRGDRHVLWLRGKGDQDASEFVILTTPVLDALRAWLRLRGERPGPLFVTATPDRRRLGTRAIRLTIKNAFKRAGVVGRRKTAHSLRHSAISIAIENGATLLQAQAFARHSRPETTLIYVHAASRLDQAAEDLVSY
jgi:integrase/recombinase XerD